MSDLPLNPATLWPSSPEEDRRSRDALDRLAVGFQIIGFDWRYLYVNPAAAAHGRQPSPRALVGRAMEDAYPGIGRTAMFRELQRCMEQRTAASLENQFTFADGTKRWFELRVQPVPEGLCIYSIDIHDRREAAAALAKRLSALESRSILSKVRFALFGR